MLARAETEPKPEASTEARRRRKVPDIFRPIFERRARYKAPMATAARPSRIHYLSPDASHAGVTVQTLQQFIAGTVELTDGQLLALARRMDCCADE